MKPKKYFSKEEYIVVIGIIAVPFFFFGYNLFPGFQSLPVPFRSGNFVLYNDLDADLWFLAGRLLIISLYSIWFITCSYKWRYWLLGLLFVQVLSVGGFVEELLASNGIFSLNLLSLIIIVLLLWALFVKGLNYLRDSLSIAVSHDVNFYSRFNKELIESLAVKSRFSSQKFREFKRRYRELKTNKDALSEKEYLKELIRLRESYSIR